MVSPAKIRGVRTCSRSALVNPIHLNASWKRTSAELPLSIITQDSSQPPTSSRITRALSCGLSRSAVSFSSNVIS